MDFFATAAKGTEPALRDELRELRLRDVRADRGGVHFKGALEDGFRACLWSRVAVRVLAWRATFDAPDEHALYDEVHAIDWTPFLTARHTLAVKATCRSSRLTHSQYIAQKTKDAIVDSLRDRLGARPDVDVRDPDVLVVVHLVRDRADLYIDMGGAALHRRGYRTRIGDAPLKETLAAAIVRLSGWDRKTPFVDPMCGSGTIAIEAGLWAQEIAPGLERDRFGFERWAYFDEGMTKRLGELRDEARERARAAAKSDTPIIRASDVDEAVLELARANASDAGVKAVFEKRAVRDLATADERGVIVTNPPYGERLEVDRALYDDLWRALTRMHGFTAAILAGSPAIQRAIPIAPKKWLLLFNGPLECKLLVYEIA
jgi:putative N6-adenine-specific DNA methylase